MTRLPLATVVDRLRERYGAPKPPPSKDPWLLILWENVAYLADDARRKAAFDLLRTRIGTKPRELLAASDEALHAVAKHGILADTFAEKLRRCARIALKEFADSDGDLKPLLAWPPAKAKKALGKFPGIGAPGAEKILLFARVEPQLALESNGLRVLTRLGFAPGGEAATKNYATNYRVVREAVAPELAAASSKRNAAATFDWLIDAHQLLRRHGQELCKRTQPKCGECPLLAECPHGRAAC